MDNLIEACIQLRKITGASSSTAARPGGMTYYILQNTLDTVEVE